MLVRIFSSKSNEANVGTEFTDTFDLVSATLPKAILRLWAREAARACLPIFRHSLSLAAREHI